MSEVYFQKYRFSSNAKLCFFFAAFLFVVLTIFGQDEVASSSSQPGGPSIKEQFEIQASEFLGVPFSVSEFGMGFSTVELSGIKIGDSSDPDSPYAELQKVSATCNFMSLLSGNLVIEKISIASLSGRLTRNASGALVLGKISPPASQDLPKKPPQSPFPELNANDLRIKVIDKGLGESFDMHIPNCGITQPSASSGLSINFDGSLNRSSGKNDSPKGGITLSGKFYTDSFSPFQGSGTITLASVFPLLFMRNGPLTGNLDATLNFSYMNETFDRLEVWAKIEGVSIPHSLFGIQKLFGEFSYKGALKGRILDGSFLASKVNFVTSMGKVPVRIETAKLNAEKLGPQSGELLFEKLVLQILGTVVEISGRVENSEDPHIRLNADSRVDMAELHRSLPINNEIFKKHTTISGKASISATVEGRLRKPEFSANVSIGEGAFSYPKKKVKVTQISSKIRADLNTATIESLRATTAKGNLTMTGTVKEFLEPTLDLSGTLNKADIAEIKTFLESRFSAFPAKMQFDGKTDIDFALSGKGSSPQISGTAKLSGDRVFHPVLLRAFTEIRGEIDFDNQTLRSENLKMKWGGSVLNLSGKIENLEKFKSALNFSIEPLDLTDIGKFFLGPTGYTLTGTGGGSGKMSGVPSKLVIAGTAKIPSGNLAAPISKANKDSFSFPFSNVVAPFSFSDGNLSISKAQASMFGGSFGGSGKIFLQKKPIGFSFNASGKAFRAESFLSQNSSQKNVISGPVDLKLQSEGDTTGLESWNGKGTLKMKDGRYNAPPVVTPVLSLLNLEQFFSGDLTGIDGTFVLVKGKLNTDDLVFQSSIGRAFFRGSVGLDTTLDGKMSLIFSQSAVEKSDILQKFSLDGTTVQIPTKVGGTLLSPSFPGFKPGKLLELGLKRKGQQILQEILTGKSKRPPTDSTDSNKEKEEPGKRLLKGLQDIFRKKQKPAEPEKKAPASPPSSPPAKEPTPPPQEKETMEKKLKKSLDKELQKLFKF